MHSAGIADRTLDVIGTFLTQRKHAARYRTVIRTFVRHGLGGLVAPFDLRVRTTLRLQAKQETLPGGPASQRSRPAHIRRTLEELGPAFVKLGQILSTRVDLLPAPYITELERLQDRVPPAPFADIREVIERELGGTVADHFSHIDAVPLAAASIGQVHAAELLDGRSVVVKVQRPDVERIVEEDLAILASMARLAQRQSIALREMDVVALVREFDWTIRGELDYRREAVHADRLGADNGLDAAIRVPKVFHELSTRRVLTLERVDGERLDRLTDNDVRQRSARALVAWFARQILDIGLFHADPHPGNFVVCADGAIGVYDFGMVGAIDDRLRERLLMLLVAVSARDTTRIVDEIAMLGALPTGWDRHALERDVSHMVSRYVGASLRDLPIAQILSDVMEMIRRHGLRLPSELALLAKTASMLEALCRQLDPDLNLLEAVDPVIQGAMRQFLSPAFWGRRLRTQPLDVMLLAAGLPGNVNRLLTRVDRNDLSFHVRFDELPATMRSLNNMVNRLALSIMTSAAWLGWILLYFIAQPDIRRFPGLLFLVGFAVLGVMVAFGMYRIWRSGR